MSGYTSLVQGQTHMLLPSENGVCWGRKDLRGPLFSIEPHSAATFVQEAEEGQCWMRSEEHGNFLVYKGCVSLVGDGDPCACGQLFCRKHVRPQLLKGILGHVSRWETILCSNELVKLLCETLIDRSIDG